MAEMLTLNFKLLTGQVDTIEISQNATVLEAKKLLHTTKRSDAPPYRQKLVIDFKAGSGTCLEDDHTLSSYPSIKSGCTIVLIIQPPWILYIQDPNDKIYEVEIPSKDPLSFKVSDLKTLFEQVAGRKFTPRDQFHFKEKPLEEEVDGRQLSLKDCDIDKEDTIFVLQTGRLVNITSPEVDICFMVDCTGSMGSWIESVKTNVKNMRDAIEKKYQECDIQFAFVRYTDYDQPKHSMTTWLDFTKSLDQFHYFVNPIKADGGGDAPEDIMGALKVTFTKLSWRPSAAKVLVHIADAPCHGKQYHGGRDNYPNGDPAGITHEQMMNEVVRLDIQYWFAYINKASTDKMISIFNDYLKTKSSQRLIIRSVDATIPDQLTDAVYKSVTASVFANEARK